MHHLIDVKSEEEIDSTLSQFKSENEKVKNEIIEQINDKTIKKLAE